MIEEQNIIKQVRETIWFASSAIKEQDLHYVSYEMGDRVSDQIEENECVGMILNGAVEVYSVADDGSSVNISVLGKNEMFGINNLFYKSRMTTKLFCMKPTKIVYIEKERFKEILNSEPQLMLKYAELCNKKIQYLIEKVELLSMQSCRNKLIQYLFAKEEDGIVRLECSKERLAKKLGVSRAALFREMSDLQKQGYISAQDRKIEIIEEDCLANILYKEEE